MPYLPGYKTSYVFDDIGNLKTRQDHDAYSAVALTSFAADNNNQYDSRTNPDPAGKVLKGFAKSTTSVAVSQTLLPQSTPTPLSVAQYAWYGGWGVNNNLDFRGWGTIAGASVTNGPAVLEIATKVTANSRSLTKTGKIFLSPKDENFDYDLNGNLTADAQWVYTWDAENRLSSAQVTDSAVNAGWPARRLEFAYDSQHRRVRKVVKGRTGRVFQSS